MRRTALTKQAPHPWPFSHGTVVEGPAQSFIVVKALLPRARRTVPARPARGQRRPRRT
jgi:hypothetical protein